MTDTATRGSLAKIRDDLVYYQHQLDGIRQMAKMTSCLLADEMGLGKSIQALTVAAIDFQLGRASKVLIVCPATLKGNWAYEIEQHTHFTYEIISGDINTRRKQIAGFRTDVLIINYELLVKHINLINDKDFDIVIYDEAQYMKNRLASRAKACRAIKARRHLLLTGSPMLNKVDDLWVLLNRIAPTDWPNYWRFVNRYCLYGGYRDKQIIGVKNEKELSERLGQVMLRRYKRDTLDLPEKQYIRIVVDLTADQRKLYDSAVEDMSIDVPGADPMEIENALVKFLRLKQICGTTACIAGYPDHSMKLDRAEEMIQEIIDSGEPVVVFTQFRDVQRCLVERLEARKIPNYQLHGDTQMTDRVPLVRQWSRGEPAALVCMIQVGGVGLTMTAASKCIFLDKLFSPKMNEQAEDRLHRIGADKTRPVQIYELFCRDTVESRVETILRRKTKVFGTVVDADSSEWKRKLIAAVLAKDDAA